MAACRVSVCMATYNGAAWVTDQVHSILEQLGSHDELVVVDDASKDATLERLAAVDDPRVRVISRHENRGYVATFVEAMTLARGEYILLADQDDVWVAGRLEAMVAVLKDVDVVASNLCTLGGPDVIPGPTGQRDWKLQATQSSRSVANIIGILAGLRPYFGCAMGVRSDALRRVLPMPAFMRESHDLWLALYGNVFGSIRHLDMRTVARRYHDNNQTPASPRSMGKVLASRFRLVACLMVLVGRKLRSYV